jgi:3',5'-nucleoside bisphosphate phosphatase
MKTIKNIFASVIMLLFFVLSLSAQDLTRTKINIPDILGYKTLKCDFHLHTVFSDGDVWPTFRVSEAWHDGLDAIALTDHLEYQPHKEDIPSNHNRPYQIAKPTADFFGLTLIQGAEITRGMPPGHMNVIFVKDGNALVKDNWKDVITEAKNQGAILFWNHPSWVSQQPDGIARWYPEHDYILQTGIMFGIEVVNTIDYSPEAHQWCIDKKLTMLGNSDSHDPEDFEYAGVVKHRPMTLVFAKENSADAIKEALLDRRTVVYSGSQLIGDEKYLREIFNNSVSFGNNKISAVGRERKYMQATNSSDIPYELTYISGDDNLQLPKKISLPAGKTILFPVRALKDNISVSGVKKFVYEVSNLISAPNKGTKIEIELDLNITPKK